MPHFRLHAIARAASLAALTSLVTPFAMAQTAAPAAAPALEVQSVEVTARRTKENLQEVPTAVTAIAAKDLEDLRISGFESVAQTAPNVYFQKQGGSPTSVQMQIRGVSNGSLNKQVDSGIGLYVDGVYFGRAGAASFDMADLERVEVLRGPQGTLFGRNATAGAINLVTAGPTGYFGGKADVGFGNFNERHAKATINTPSVNGLSARLTLGYSSVEGDVKNTAPKQTFRFTGDYVDSLTTNDRGGDNRSDSAMVALRYKGLPGLTVDYKFDLNNTKGTMNYRQTGTVDNNGVPQGFTYRDSSFQPLEGEFTNRVRGQSLVAEYELSKDIALKYIYGTRRYNQVVPGNQVLGDQFTFNSPTFDTTSTGTGSIVTFGLFAARHEDHKQASHELQLLGKGSSVDWLLGAFTFKESGALNNPILLDLTGGANPLVIGPTNAVSAAGFNYFIGQKLFVDNRSKAVYGHLNWKVGGGWTLGGGVRRTQDDRAEDITAAGALANTVRTYSGGNTDFDVSATFQVNKDTNLYAKYATGYVSGGSLGGTVFVPEKMKSVELGAKTLLLERKLRLNAAVFEQKRIDAQIEYFGAAGYSMGKADFKQTGLELEASLVVTSNFRLNSSLGITENNSSGDVLVTQPKQNAYLGGEYVLPAIMGLTPTFRVDVNWRPGYYTIKCPAGQTQDAGRDTCSGTTVAALDAAAKIKGETNLNMRLSFDEIKLGGSATGRLSVWGRNLTNNRNAQYTFSLGATTLASTFERPRTFGVDFSADF